MTNNILMKLSKPNNSKLECVLVLNKEKRTNILASTIAQFWQDSKHRVLCLLSVNTLNLYLLVVGMHLCKMTVLIKLENDSTFEIIGIR